MRSAKASQPAPAPSPADPFATAIRNFLTRQPRQLPSRFLYDPLGSALFDAICRLPWYGLTAAELRLLGEHGAAILARVGPLGRIVEMGSGNGEKAAALAGARPSTTPLDLHLIDISPAALTTATQALAQFEHLRVFTHEGNYEADLARLSRKFQGPGRTLMLFLGSNIGNYDPPAAAALLRSIRSSLRPGDGFLLGADLVKSDRDLQLAYDDPLGVTAAFNRNLLVRINRELDGDFDLAGFSHRAVWNAEESRVEMHLVSLRSQRVRVARAGLDITLAEGEHIWTESSYKYRREDVAARLVSAGFEVRDQWIEPAAQFSLTLAAVP
ncbi:MAG: L-histidine N(alpha)-methyltransferase [Vicinamibacterales bacterium]